MSNPWGRSGAPMIQPTKGEFRAWLYQAQSDLNEEMRRRSAAEQKLSAVMRVLGALALEGKVSIPLEKLGELVLEAALEQEAKREKQKLLSE